MAGVGALRRLSASVLALGRIRLELFALEVQEEKQRLAQLAFWAVLSALAVAFSGVFVALALTVWLWDSHRLLALAAAALAWMALSALGLMRLQRLVGSASTLFTASLAELRQDEAALRGVVGPPVGAPRAPSEPPRAASGPAEAGLG